MNRVGRVAFVLLCVVAFALLIVAVLVFAGVGVKDQPDATTPSARGSSAGRIAYAPTTTGSLATIPDPPATSTSSATTEPPPPPQVAGRTTPAVLVVTATRGDCWLEVHRGSQTGAVRFAATLPLGQTIRFQGSRFWVRFGGAGNVDVRFGGKPVLMPSGTVALVLARPTRA